MLLGEALAFLDDHQNLEAMTSAGRVAAPDIERARRITHLMGDPQSQYPVIHITGTNGKTSTARILTALLVARGLSVGTFTSPHLERVNERMAWNGDPIPDDALADVLSAVADLEPLLAPERLTWFEIITAAAFRWFADVAVDVAVVEVGMGGRWDATNVADATVAVVTNIGVDHVEYLGPDRQGIAQEKAGIVKPGSTLVLGETDPDIAKVFLSVASGDAWQRGSHFLCEDTRVAIGGQVVDLRTPGAGYRDVFLQLHGAYQADNASIALAAAEAFFGAPLDEDVVAEAFYGVRSPGRMEVVGRQPLCILDGAHNAAAAAALADTLVREFAGIQGRVIVVGMLKGRDPVELLSLLSTSDTRLVVATAPMTPRAIPAAEVADAARELGLEVEVASSVAEAVSRALAMSGEEDLVLVTGSLYVVGEARAALRRGVG